MKFILTGTQTLDIKNDQLASSSWDEMTGRGKD